MSSEMIRTGDGRQEGGYRQVALTPQGEIRPVCKVQRKGCRSKRTTYQNPQIGDVIIGMRWYPAAMYIQLVKEDETVELIPTAVLEPNYARLIQGMPVALKEWLVPAVGEPSILPEGCGWSDDMTTHDIRKKADIFEFFAGAGEGWLEGLWKDAKVSPYEGLPRKWSLANPVPPLMTNERQEYKTSLHEVVQYVQYVVWRTDGRVDVISPIPTSGAYGGTIPSLPSGVWESTPLPMPADAVKVVRLVRGYYRDGSGNSYGVRWSLHTY